MWHNGLGVQGVVGGCVNGRERVGFEVRGVEEEAVPV